MGFFKNLFKRKSKEPVQELTPEQKLVLKDGIYATPEERGAFVKNCCDIIIEAKRQRFEAKKEYEVVTSYLADIQKIDLLPPQPKKSIEDMARKLTVLNEERQKMQKIPPKITIAQRMALEPYEDTILEEIRRMEENEQYLERINSDIRQLESEKASIDYEMEDVVDRDESGRKMFTIATVFIVLFLIFLFVLQEVAQKDVQIPFLLTVAFGIIVIAYFYFSNRLILLGLNWFTGKSRRRVIFEAGIFAGGGLLIALSALMYILFTGSWSDFINQNFAYAVNFAHQRGAGGSWQYFCDCLFPFYQEEFWYCNAFFALMPLGAMVMLYFSVRRGFLEGMPNR